MVSFNGQGSTVEAVEPLLGKRSVLTTKAPRVSGTHLIDLGRMKG